MRPGVVRVYASSPRGILDLGRYPNGPDERADCIAADLVSAGYHSRALEDPMRWKYTKLLGNIGNSLQALCGPEADTSDLASRARDEALRCYEAAGIEHVSREEREERTAARLFEPVHGEHHRGGSSWQSMMRGAGSIEAAYLNGEIVLLGRLHGVPTPVNTTLSELAQRAAQAGAGAASMTVEQVSAAISSSQAPS
jgi:2-dehydropantoate 2-reductase